MRAPAPAKPGEPSCFYTFTLLHFPPWFSNLNTAFNRKTHSLSCSPPEHRRATHINRCQHRETSAQPHVTSVDTFKFRRTVSAEQNSFVRDLQAQRSETQEPSTSLLIQINRSKVNLSTQSTTSKWQPKHNSPKSASNCATKSDGKYETKQQPPPQQSQTQCAANQKSPPSIRNI